MKFYLSRESLGLSMLIVLVLFFAILPNASALTIIRNYTGGLAPTNATGGGNLIDVFNAAAKWWETAILDPYTLALNFGWGPLGSNIIGIHVLLGQADPDGSGLLPSRETWGFIRFDNDGSSRWFMDPTPYDNSEYQTFRESSANLGGGVINTGRVFTNPIGAAVGKIDLLSVAKQEIGHALGLSSGNVSFRSETRDSDVDVVLGVPFSGSVIRTQNGGHLRINTALMTPSIGAGMRRTLSGADILANAEVSDFRSLNFNPSPGLSLSLSSNLSLDDSLEPDLGEGDILIASDMLQTPEPSTFVLLGIGLVGLVVIRLRKKK